MLEKYSCDICIECERMGKTMPAERKGAHRHEDHEQPPRTYRRTAERCELRQAVHAAKSSVQNLRRRRTRGASEGTQLHCLVLHENNRIQWLIKGKKIRVDIGKMEELGFEVQRDS